MIPSFPQLEPLSREDCHAVAAYTHRFPTYSDYNFASLWAWDVKHTRELSELNGNLVVKFTDYATGEPFFSFLGTNEVERTARALLEFSEALGLPAVLNLVPEVSVQGIDSHAISVVADQASFDYVYLAESIGAYAGAKYKSKRGAVNSFVAANPDHAFSVVPLSDAHAREAIWSIAKAWRKQRDPGMENPALACELAAIERIMPLAATQRLLVGIVSTGGVPTSFTLEEVERTNALSHFCKTANRIDGENEYLSREMAKCLQQREVIHLNWEQDLGIESLRASKMSYRPTHFLKKFIVARSSTQSIVRRSIRP